MTSEFWKELSLKMRRERSVSREMEIFFEDPLNFKRPENGENISDILKRTREFWIEKTTDPALADKTVLDFFSRMCSPRTASEHLSGSCTFLAWMCAA